MQYNLEKLETFPAFVLINNARELLENELKTGNSCNKAHLYQLIKGAETLLNTKGN